MIAKKKIIAPTGIKVTKILAMPISQPPLSPGVPQLESKLIITNITIEPRSGVTMEPIKAQQIARKRRRKTDMSVSTLGSFAF